jgi:hypothetical protein
MKTIVYKYDNLSVVIDKNSDPENVKLFNKVLKKLGRIPKGRTK